MAHFAEINEEGIVLRVIVAEQDFIDSGVVGNPDNWIQTSYNIRGGEYNLGATQEEKSQNKDSGNLQDKVARTRKNYAGIGYSYDLERGAFISPKPFNSWLLNEETCLWEAPVPYPDDGEKYDWDEDIINWVLR